MEEKSLTGNSPAISLPKGGGAIQSIGETFQPDLFTGTGNFSVPIFTSPGRSGFRPNLTLQYSSGNGNGIFGMGWRLAVPSIARKTAKGLPQYREDDLFVLSGSEDLVPKFVDGSQTIESKVITRLSGSNAKRYRITRFLPRNESLFARIEAWQELATDDAVLNHFWRVTTKENVTSIYGRTPASRIADSNNPMRIFEWLLEESFDAKGNHIAYDYTCDNPVLAIDAIEEQNRAYNQRYPRRIFYGNVPGQLTDFNGGHFSVGPVRAGTNHRDMFETVQRNYVFEVVFDYGDWSTPQSNSGAFIYQTPSSASEQFTGSAPLRPDPFSTFRPGFELRTMRRCRQVLMIHHFRELGGPYLVKSTDFNYRESEETATSFLQSVTVTGYVKSAGGDNYLFESMPPVDFKYSEFQPGKQRYQSVTAASNELPPQSLRDAGTALVDMFGNGLPDVVQSSAAGFRYWRNLGGGKLDRPKILTESPAGVTLAQNGVSFGDMGGDGLADLIIHNGAVNGFYEMVPEHEVDGEMTGGWSPISFRHYHDLPAIDLVDPNLRMLDLTGDGLTDLLVARDDFFIWYRSQGERGFEPQAVTPKPDGLREIGFNDPSGRLRLADMSGDGLNDIVWVHNGRVEYWPNLGYGNFGVRITMANAPHFPQDFDAKRLFLADLDGSGAADLVYVDFDEVHFWLNGSGNKWSDRHTISGTPVTTDTTSLSFTDFFGNGTSCLLWSYDFGTFPGSNYKVLDFCGGEKPHLLTEMDNNLGATTKVGYASSTRFYLEDASQGRPWATPLPFPVQVVEKSETIDHVSKTKLVTCYKYHHGFFDGREREFRGFGRVDQIDSESFTRFQTDGLHQGAGFTNGDRAHYVPPVETRMWFHTGAYFENRDILAHYRKEYLSGPANLAAGDRPADDEAFAIANHDFKIAEDELVEAHRALRGAVLRREVFALDGSPEQNFPYTVTESAYRVESKQARGKTTQNQQSNPYAVFTTTRLETLSSHYERRHNGRYLADPRVEHDLALDVDEFGNVRHSAAISYRRRETIYPEQDKDAIVVTNNTYVNLLETDTDFRHSNIAGARVYELTGLNRNAAEPYRGSDLLAKFNSAQHLAFEQKATPGLLQKRLLKQQTTLFWNEDLTDALPEKSIASHGLPYESYQLALTAALRRKIYGDRLTPAMAAEAGYRQKVGSRWQQAGSGDWMIPSGTQEFNAGQFYLSDEVIDPFGNKSAIVYDPYMLFPARLTDPAGNRVEGLMNYRVLQTFWARDINGNHSEAAFDVLGFVAGTAVMGKAGADPSQSILGISAAALDQMRATSEADTLAGFQPDLVRFDAEDGPERYSQIAQFLADPDGAGNGVYSAGNIHTCLRKATSRIIYDVHRYRLEQKPVSFCVVAREKHAGSTGGDVSPLQIARTYSDGFARQIQSKSQAEGTIDAGSNEAMRRWITSGWAVFNNKGKPVQQYEPFFSETQEFEFGHRQGVSQNHFYDPIGRIVCTLHANGTYQKILFDPWRLESWDVNDTVLLSPQEDPDVQRHVTPYFQNLPSFKTWFEQRIPDPANPPPAGGRSAEQDAALKTAGHADTPKVTHLDVQGNAFLAVFDNQTELLETRIEYDIEGNDLRVTDARGIDGFVHSIDMTGRKLHIDSKDAGLKIIFPAVDDNTVYDWDASDNRLHTRYDGLRRTTEKRVKKNGSPEFLAEKYIYGETRPAAATGNLRGVVWKAYDGAGLAINDRLDFKGNVLAASRHLLRDNKMIEPAWPLDSSGSFDETAAAALIESTAYSIKNTFDALGRPVTKELPDATQLSLTFNEAGLLQKLVALKPGGHSELFVQNVDYNAKGQRISIEYGNGVTTHYKYEPETFRLSEVASTRESPSPKTLQKLSYTYDAIGNITHIRDDAHSTIFGNNQAVAPLSSFTYDAVYRLRQATGREHEAMTACHYQTGGFKQTEFLPHPQPVANAQALLTYTEKYNYDKSGNITRIAHTNSRRSYIRNQTYSAENNRLLTTSAGCTREDVAFEHDPNGNVIHLPHLPVLMWDYKNQLVNAHLNSAATPNEAFYQYDSAGQRIRKTVVKNSGSYIAERIYLGDYEIYTERNQTGVQKRRDAIHIMDDQQRIVLIEQEKDPAAPGTVLTETVRYQMANHLGSAVLELDGAANFISYEEYYPFGDTAYLSGRSQAETSLKRYRFSGKERDDETGLYYYGVRYYAPWLGRWLNADPSGSIDSANLYVFNKNSPMDFVDLDGRESKKKSVDDVAVERVQAVDQIYKEAQLNVENDPRTAKLPSDQKGKLMEKQTQDRVVRGKEVPGKWRDEVDLRQGNNRTGTILDLREDETRTNLELKKSKSAGSGSKKLRQQRIQQTNSILEGGRYAKVTADAESEIVSFDRRGGRSFKTRGFATLGTMVGSMAVGGGLMLLSGYGELKGILDAAETIDEAKAATAPIKAKSKIKEINLARINQNSGLNLDLHFVHNGDQELNVLIDANSGRLFGVVTEDTDNFSAGQIVQIGDTIRVDDRPLAFKDLETGDVYTRTNGWQRIGPSNQDQDPYSWPASWLFSPPEWGIELYPEFPCWCR